MKLNQSDISPSSIHSFQHKMCLRKKPYNTEEEAKKACRAIWKRKKYYMKYYICPICATKGKQAWHIAKDLDRMWKKCK